jgi:hypothetical protein
MTKEELRKIVRTLKKCPDVKAEEVAYLIKQRQMYLDQEPEHEYA